MRSRPPEAWMYLAMRLSTFCVGACPTTGAAAASAARHSGTIRGIGDLSKALNRDRKRTGPSADPRVIPTVALPRCASEPVRSAKSRPGKAARMMPSGRPKARSTTNNEMRREETPMFLTTRNSQRDSTANDLTNRVNRLLSDALGLNGIDWQYRDSVGASWVPPVDIFEEADAIRIMAEIPGVKPEDVKITHEGNVLTIHGQKQQSAEERTERVHRYERTYGVFERTFSLPATVDANNIKASYDQGVLTVTIPKTAEARPRQIQVDVAQPAKQVNK